jgi:hypothetical protein
MLAQIKQKKTNFIIFSLYFNLKIAKNGIYTHSIFE